MYSEMYACTDLLIYSHLFVKILGYNCIVLYMTFT